MQLFVSDKVLIKVYGMKSKSEFPQALKLFSNKVGVPNAFILDPSGEQTSINVCAFCHKIGTTLRILEEQTQHADCAQLYLGCEVGYGRSTLCTVTPQLHGIMRLPHVLAHRFLQ